MKSNNLYVLCTYLISLHITYIIKVGIGLINQRAIDLHFE